MESIWAYFQSEFNQCQDAIRDLMTDGVMTEQEWREQALVLFKAQAGIGYRDDVADFLRSVHDEWLTRDDSEFIYRSPHIAQRLDEILEIMSIESTNYY